MKEKTTKNFETINKDAIVGSGNRKFFIIDPPRPKKAAGKTSSVTIKHSRSKRRKCSGCSRRRSSKGA